MTGATHRTDLKPDKTLLLVERENYVNGGIHFDVLTVQSGWLILPLPHGIQCRLHQERVTGNHFKLLDSTVLGDDGVQPYRAGDTRLARQRRIHRLYLVPQLGSLHLTALADALLSRLRWWRCCAYAANDAADNATHLATSDAANYSSLHTRHVWSILLNNLDVLWYDLRRTQLPGIHQVDSRLDVNDLSDRRWRGRWRRRRRD